MPSQFPTPYNATYPTEPAGPPYLKLLDHPIEYPSTVIKEFKDGGVSIGLPNANGVRRFEFEYDGLTGLWLSMLIDHRDSAYFQVYGFNFRHPRTGFLWSDVHYEVFEVDHTKTWSNKCHLILIKRPA